MKVVVRTETDRGGDSQVTVVRDDGSRHDGCYDEDSVVTIEKREVSDTEFESFLAGYIEAALWSSVHDPEFDDERVDACEANQLSRQARKVMELDALAFYVLNRETIASATDGTGGGLNEDRWAQAGNDFCLTRNSEGAGFWDGDWSEPHATALTNAAHAFGEFFLILNADDTIDVGQV